MNTGNKMPSTTREEGFERTVEWLDEQSELRPCYWSLHADEALLSVARATDPRMRDHLADVFSAHLEQVARSNPVLLDDWTITTAREGGARSWAEGVEDKCLEEFGPRHQDLVEAYRAERAKALQAELEDETDLAVGAE